MSEENKELSLTTDNEAGIDLVRKLTGEYGVNDNPNKLKWINLSGKDGQYTIKDGEDVKVIGEEISGVIFKVTKKVQSDMKSEHNVRSDEFTNMEEITIIDAQSKNVLESGSYEKLKVKYDLKLLNVLYLYVVEIDMYVKLQISGSSLGNLWDYLGSFGSKDTVARYFTSFGVEKAEFKDPKGMKITYYKATFKRGDLVPAEKLQEVLGELSKVNIQLSPSTTKKLELIDTGEELTLDDIPFKG